MFMIIPGHVVKAYGAIQMKRLSLPEHSAGAVMMDGLVARLEAEESMTKLQPPGSPRLQLSQYCHKKYQPGYGEWADDKTVDRWLLTFRELT